VFKVADERLADGIDERAAGLVAYGNADAAIEGVGLLYVVGCEEEIVLAVEMNGGRSPDGVRGPCYVLHAED